MPPRAQCRQGRMPPFAPYSRRHWERGGKNTSTKSCGFVLVKGLMSVVCVGVSVRETVARTIWTTSRGGTRRPRGT